MNKHYVSSIPGDFTSQTSMADLKLLEAEN